MKNLIPTLICLFLVVPSQAGIIYVDADANGADDGSSWAYAYNYLQDALADANSNVDVNEIWVAQGTYTPDSNSADPNGSGVREATFQLISGVTLKGGYAGYGEPDPNAQDVELYETILSGDLNDDDVDVNDPWDLWGEPTRAENSYTVVTGSGTDPNAVLNGFTIRGGNSNGEPDTQSYGGGVYILYGSPKLLSCIITANSAAGYGGIYGRYASPTITDCNISYNFHIGIGFENDGNSTITNCTVSNNSYGGIYCFETTLNISNCIISDNSRTGIRCRASSSVITDCRIENNTSGGSGGGIYFDSEYDPCSNATLTNCIIVGNSAANGGGIACYYASPTIVGCTITGNSSGGGIRGDGAQSSRPIIAYCTISDNSGWGLYYCDGPITNCTISGNSGGGLYYCDGPITNCTISSNSGGGLYWCNGPITNCVISGNLDRKYGGGLYYCDGPITNCTISGNLVSRYGGGLSFCDGPITSCTISGNVAGDICGGLYWCNGSITNCILWANTDSNGTEESSQIYWGTPDLMFNCIQGWSGTLGGTGNIKADPCFVEPGFWADANDPNIVVEPNDPNALWIDGDYHLKSFGWRWDTQRKVWTWDDVTSRCIDAGNPGSSVGEELLSVPVDPNNEWGQNLRINMGAYGGTAEASMPPYDWALLADLTNDGTVNFEDYAAQAIDWLESVSEQPGDLNRNGTVDIADIALLTEDWLKQTSWYTP